MSLEFKYQEGQIFIRGFSKEQEAIFHAKGYKKDADQFKALGCSYRELVLLAHEYEWEYKDLVKNYKDLKLPILPFKPMVHQDEAVSAWQKNNGLGVIVLPTGAGKTITALLALKLISRSTLIVVPTIELVLQWKKEIFNHLGVEAGQLGAGLKDVKEITVATYDSAYIFALSLGAFYGLVIFDECHHLPANQNSNIARFFIAPFRLGLSATLERADGKETELAQLIGDVVYKKEIKDLPEGILSPFSIKTIEVELTPQEKELYQVHRGEYLSYLRASNINLGQKGAWQRFIMLSSRSPKGRKALKSFHEQKRIGQRASKKFEVVWDILKRHQGERSIIFTDDNEFAYAVGEKFLLPVLTHKTLKAERKEFLKLFTEGKVSALVTSKVLNEGVDVPEASVAIILSGSGSVREHVQRLGRILRSVPGKEAVLYEVVSKDTSENYVSQRRRQHDAYQSSTSH